MLMRLCQQRISNQHKIFGNVCKQKLSKKVNLQEINEFESTHIMISCDSPWNSYFEICVCKCVKNKMCLMVF